MHLIMIIDLCTGGWSYKDTFALCIKIGNRTTKKEACPLLCFLFFKLDPLNALFNSSMKFLFSD